MSVSLYLQEKMAHLIVENNGQIIENNSIVEGVNYVGYGTKMMNTITSDLPEGEWGRKYLENGGVRVALKWNMNYFFVDDNE